jgi:hypothetical protein
MANPVTTATATELDDAITRYRARLLVPTLNKGQLTMGVRKTPAGDVQYPLVRGGQFARVYRINDVNKVARAVRCYYTAPRPQFRRRYDLIDDFFHNNVPKITADFWFHERGLRISTQPDVVMPIMEMEWIEGQTLLARVDKLTQQGDKASLRTLAHAWIELVGEMKKHRMGHGDLSGENVMVRNSDNSLVVIDYDGVYIPQLAGETTDQAGNAAYQHPDMHNRPFNEHMDNFSALVIYVGLLALAEQPQLWNSYSLHDAAGNLQVDTLLFNPNDLRDPNNSKLFGDLARITNPDFRSALQSLKSACVGPVTAVPDVMKALEPHCPHCGAKYTKGRVLCAACGKALMAPTAIPIITTTPVPPIATVSPQGFGIAQGARPISPQIPHQVRTPHASASGAPAPQPHSMAYHINRIKSGQLQTGPLSTTQTGPLSSHPAPPRSAQPSTSRAIGTAKALTGARVGWGFWFVWVLGTLITAAAGYVVVGVVSLYYVGSWFTSLVPVVIVSSLVGLVQWAALRPHVFGIGLWLLSVVTGAAATVLAMDVSLGGLLSTAAGGLLAILLQWLMLRGRGLRAGSWILWGAVGWVAGIAELVLLFGAFNAWYWYDSPGFAVLVGLVPTVGSAPITGAGLIWLLRRSASRPTLRATYWPVFWVLILTSLSATIALAISTGVIRMGSIVDVSATATPEAEATVISQIETEATAVAEIQAQATATAEWLETRLLSNSLEVYAADGWQNTGLYVVEGETISIGYRVGEWSVCCDTGNAFYEPPDHGEYYYFKPDGAPFGGIVEDADLCALIARIGDGDAFSVGRQISITSSVSGQLYLRANDHDGGLSDNAGGVVVQAQIYPR